MPPQGANGRAINLPSVIFQVVKKNNNNPTSQKNPPLQVSQRTNNNYLRRDAYSRYRHRYNGPGELYLPNTGINATRLNSKPLPCFLKKGLSCCSCWCSMLQMPALSVSVRLLSMLYDCNTRPKSRGRHRT